MSKKKEKFEIKQRFVTFEMETLERWLNKNLKNLTVRVTEDGIEADDDSETMLLKRAKMNDQLNFIKDGFKDAFTHMFHDDDD